MDRQAPIVNADVGYAEWAANYEETPLEAMDTFKRSMVLTSRRMLERARARNAYDQLNVASVTDIAFPDAAYALATMSLADEHLADLMPLYKEAARIIRADGLFILIGYHPHFLLNGMPTHYHRDDGEAVTIQSYVHLLSDHVRAAFAAGWTLRQLDEALIGDDWIARKPKWERWRNHPISFLALWQKG